MIHTYQKPLCGKRVGIVFDGNIPADILTELEILE